MNIAERFWTDSQVVLAYIRSSTKRFKVFVVNQVQKIQEHSDVNQWSYVKGKGNLADGASRGLDPRKQTSSSRWFTGPAFLWQREELWPSYSEVTCIGDDEPEIKRDIKVNAVQLVNDVLENVEKRVSNWCKLKRIIALVLIYLRRLLFKVHRKKGMVQMTASYDIVHTTQSFPDLTSVQMSEPVIIKSSQRRYFSNELKILEQKGILNKKSSIYKLDPYLDRCGLLRVGGRIQKSAVSEEMKHIVLLVRNSEIAVMIIRWCHEKVAHSGSSVTMNYIRSSVFWIISCNTTVRYCILKSVTCRYLRGNFQHQKMASFPSDRLCEEPPFTYCGVDLFGPFVTRKAAKN